MQHAAGEFFVLTNWNAENFRLMKCSAKNTAKEAWSEVLPHRKS
ncbi:MAG: hypothetical protein IPP33_16655 [Flavobacteriales bacterium]|nr:hypothetical protein [Flavobacteriales bacterium]